MDKILEGTLNSPHPEELKGLLINRIIQSASVCRDEAVARNIFRYCSDVILKANSSFDVSMARKVITAWSRANSQIAASCVLDDMEKNMNTTLPLEKKKWIELVTGILPIIRNADSSFDESSVLEKLMQGFLRETEIEIASAISQILIQNWNINLADGIENDLISNTITLLKNCGLDDATAQENPSKIDEIPSSKVVQINSITTLLSKVIAKDKQFLQTVLTKLSAVLLNDSSSSNIALASLLQFIPPEMSKITAEILVKDIRIKDQNIKMVFSKLIDWLLWPGVKNLDIWIVNFLKHLLLAGRKGPLVADFVEKKIEKVFQFLESLSSRQMALPIFMYMMTVYQHSPKVLHQVAPKIPALMTKIKEDPPSVYTTLALKSIAELMYTLMYSFPGYPNVYSQLIDAVKDFEKPSQDNMKRWLSVGCCISKDLTAIPVTDSTFLQRKSITGKTGLINLGNTCYMNSVVQALLMLKEFQANLLSLSLTPDGKPTAYSLQRLFAFLLFSERPAVSPDQFYKISRPPWFRQGAQQDCSEFLKYLLDKLETESKVQESQNIHLHTLFTGECRVDIKCSNCNQISSRFEAFNDIPLSFPDNQENGNGPYCLKGGDISKAIANDRVSAAGSISPNDSKGIITPEEIMIPQSQDPAVTSLSLGKQDLHNVVQSDTNVSLDLQGLLDNYLSTEYLVEQNKYMCDRCQSLQDAEQRHFFTSCPKYLVLTLKRFTYDMKTHTRSKILKNVDYPMNLMVPVAALEDNKMSTDDIEMKDIAECENIARSIDPATTSMGGSESVESELVASSFFINLEKPEKPVIDTVNMTCKNYTLVAIIVHSGISSESGHYYCYSRERIDNQALNKGSSPQPHNSQMMTDVNFSTDMSSEDDFTQKAFKEKSNWYIFNDSNVSYIESTTIENLHIKFPRDTPYVFIYEEISQDHASLISLDNIRPEIALAVRHDNEQFYKEQSLTSKQRSVGISDLSKRYKKDDEDDDDEDNGTSRNCGGAFSNLGFDASRFIF